MSGSVRYTSDRSAGKTQCLLVLSNSPVAGSLPDSHSLLRARRAKQRVEELQANWSAHVFFAAGHNDHCFLLMCQTYAVQSLTMYCLKEGSAAHSVPGSMLVHPQW